MQQVKMSTTGGTRSRSSENLDRSGQRLGFSKGEFARERWHGNRWFYWTIAGNAISGRDSRRKYRRCDGNEVEGGSSPLPSGLDTFASDYPNCGLRPCDRRTAPRTHSGYQFIRIVGYPKHGQPEISRRGRRAWKFNFPPSGEGGRVEFPKLPSVLLLHGRNFGERRGELWEVAWLGRCC